MNTFHSSLGLNADASKSTTIGIALDGAAGEVDGSCIGRGRGDCFSSCSVVARGVVDIRIRQCTAAVYIALHLARTHVYRHAAAHVGQVAAAIDVAVNSGASRCLALGHRHRTYQQHHRHHKGGAEGVPCHNDMFDSTIHRSYLFLYAVSLF